MVAREVTKCLIGHLPNNASCAPAATFPYEWRDTRRESTIDSYDLCRFQGIPNYHFQFTLTNGTQWDVTFTAVRGHVMQHEFPPECKSWKGYPAKNLFDAEVIRRVHAVRFHDILSTAPASVLHDVCQACSHTQGGLLYPSGLGYSPQDILKYQCISWDSSHLF
jgi:hypothetical protein